MNAADLVDVDIEGLNLAGDGVAHGSRRSFVVPFTIPGERVRIRPSRSGPAAALVAVLHPSPDRTVAPCPHFGPAAAVSGGICGGCRWQHISYPRQLRLKTDLITRIVREVAPDAPPAAPTLTATPLTFPWEYRQKVHFVWGAAEPPAGRRGGAGRLVMGHYARGTRRVVPVRECAVHDPRGNALAFAMRDACVASGVPPGAVSGVAVRVGRATGERLLTLVVPDTRSRNVHRATARLMREVPPDGLHLNVHPEADAFIFGPHTRRIDGVERLREVVAGTTFLVSPTAFFQTNVAAAEILVRLVCAAVPARARVLDLYAGAGLFALPLARAGHEVLAVEENREAVADAAASARLNRIPPGACRFVTGRVEAALGRIRRPPDAVVLDPPRDGCSPAVIDRLFGILRPRVAVYISCNPAALGRDLERVTGHGYAIRQVQPVDMFPHTPHVETVVVVARGDRD